MDARALANRLGVAGPVAGVGVLIVLAGGDLISVSKQAASWFGELRERTLGAAATVLIFVLSAYIVAPQFALIGACVVAFGPWLGFCIRWPHGRLRRHHVLHRPPRRRGLSPALWRFGGEPHVALHRPQLTFSPA